MHMQGLSSMSLNRLDNIGQICTWWGRILLLYCFGRERERNGKGEI